MINIRTFNSLLTKNESGILEFKREWYWDKQTSKSLIEQGWGEFLKDFSSLVNANKDFFNEKRYLIFGVSDDKSLIGIDIDANYLQKLKSQISDKISSFLSFVPLYTIEIIEKDSKNFLVITIEQPSEILKVKKEFTDKKNNISRVNSIYVRGIRGIPDQIDICDEVELFHLCQLLGITYEVNDNYKLINKIEYRNIDKAMDCFLNINQLYSLSSGFPKNIENSTLKYKAKLYEFDDGFENTVIFLYINSSTNIKQLIIQLKKENIIKDKFTLITDQPIDVDPDTRLMNIENSFKEAGFKLVKLIYLHEFGINFLYKNPLKNIQFKRFSENSSYVESTASVKNKLLTRKAHRILNDWYKEVYKPIIVIQGEGGIGKTTLVKKHINKISDLNHENKIIYMSSSDILKKINIDEYDKNIVLYDLYNIGNKDNKHKFNNDLLKFSLDDGKVILVLDGIDEVISSLGSSFDFDFFIKDIINEYCFNNGNCKILLTCRNQFWEQLNYDFDEHITVVNLRPFDENQVTEYFEKTFTNSGDIRKCMQYTKRFSKNNKEYSPFMLDTIKYLVERNEDYVKKGITNLTDDETEDSNDFPDKYIMLSDDSNDFLIYSICNRERIKLGIYDFKDQLDIFIKLAVEFNGEIEVSKLANIFPTVDNYKYISLSSHPLLLKVNEYSGEKITFKYDFLKSYFEELFISKKTSSLDYNDLDEYFFNSLSNIGYANQLANNIFNRVYTHLQDLEDEFIEYCLYTLINIKNKENNIKNKMIYSNFLILNMYLYTKVFSKTADNFISEVLQNSNTIEDLYIVNISQNYNSSKKLSLNFNGKHVKNSFFQNYDFFWDCKFDENTLFSDCEIKSIKGKPSKNTKITKNTFKQCKTDISFQDVLSDFLDIKENIISKNRKNVFKIFKIFVSNGNFLPQKIVRVNSDVSKFSGNQVLEKLLKNNVIIKYTDSYMLEDEYIIATDYEDLLDVVTQGNNSIKMDKLIELVTNN